MTLDEKLTVVGVDLCNFTRLEQLLRISTRVLEKLVSKAV